MSARAWQAWAALAVAGVALVAGLLAARGPAPEDMLEKYGRGQALRAKQRAEAKVEAEAAFERAKAEQEKLEAEMARNRADLRSDSPASVVVSVGADTLSIGGVEMTPDEAEQTFRAAYDRDPQTQIVLQAEPGVAHGRVVDLMERAKGVGLTRLAIGTANDP